MRLKDKTAIVVGAGQTPGSTIGNGRAMAILFAREGAEVLCVDREKARAEETAAAIAAEGGRAAAHQANIVEPGAAEGLIAAAKARFGRIDILVNNVGIGGGDGPAHVVEEAMFDRIMTVNLKGMWLTIRATIPIMREARRGAIVNISSLAALGGGNQTAYEVSKAAVNRLTTSVAQANARYGIRCNAVQPGLMDTPMAVAGIAAARGRDEAAVRAERDARVPLGGKMGSAWDTAYAALFLASDEAKFITGALLPVDGGMSVRIGMTAKAASQLWKDGDSAQALEAAWTGFDGGDLDGGILAARILREEPALLQAGRAESLRRLLTNPRISPSAVSTAGWQYLSTGSDLFAGTSDDIAARLERSALALTLLREDIVVNATAERALTAVRRTLLMEDKARAFPALSAALVAQAALNGGAWPFEEDERARLAALPDFAPAYLPPRPAAAPPSDYADPVTRAVAAQYEGWPYPTWTRVTARRRTTLAAQVRELDPDGPATAETPADILIAGCGSGQQVALAAQEMPGERFTVIDISRASLGEAERRCTALGFTGIEYRHLDLHAAESLGRRFDAVWCTGVLHHLPDPERGWAALESVLKPGGIMHIMVYSRAARLRVRAIRRFLGPLVDRPVDDDLLRAVRRRVLTMPKVAVPTGRDFYSLAGTHDLLLHRHEDPFTVPRIRQALDGLGLKLVRFQLPGRQHSRNYKALYPDDTLQRDFGNWAAMELAQPTLFASMYDFFCRKPL